MVFKSRDRTPPKYFCWRCKFSQRTGVDKRGCALLEYSEKVATASYRNNLGLHIAMHHALLLPEIIATILRIETSSPRFLYTCLFINKTFSLEASRILWEGCGARYDSAIARHITPHIKHLAYIILKDPPRAQFYANFIQFLMFQDEGESNDFLDEARWHKELTSLQYPHLYEIGLYDSYNATILNRGDIVIRYAQPSIRTFTLSQGSRLSDNFLDSLSRACPKLRSLTLNRISENSVSEDGLVKFLNSTNSLSYLDIQTGLDDSWSYKAFDAITRYRNLKLLSIPDIPDNWVHSLRNSKHAFPAFPELRHLYTGTSDEGLECLARYVPNLETLSISLQCFPPSHNILASASNFTQLTRLAIHFGPQSSLSGHDLVALAQKCPELMELSIGANKGHCPSGSNINDSIIDEMAQKMLKVSELSLILDRPDLLTWRSLLSLARHCKTLDMLKISCNFTWQEAVNGIKENSFPKLWALEIILDQNNRESQLATNDEEMINSFATRIATWALKLTSFIIEGGDETDQAIEDVVSDICLSRY
jgi:hypothetical protein